MGKSIRFAVLTVALIGASSMVSSCAARSRMGEVVINQVGAQPCFAIEDTEQTRRSQPRLSALSVHSESGPSKGKVWGVSVPASADGPSMTPPACWVYGVAPAGLPNPNAATLVSGTLYSVAIKVRRGEEGDPTLAYMGEFCLLKQADQSLLVHQVRWDERAGQWQRDICYQK